ELQAMAGSAGLLLPAELTMLGKVLMHLDQLMVILSPGFVPSDGIREYASEIVRERSAGMLSLTRLLRSALEAGELAQSLPQRMNRITELIAENRIKIDVDA